MPETCDKLEWLEALRAGDASACEQLYLFIRDRILPAMPIRPGVDREEVLADTASTVWLSIKSLREENKFFSFVATIARRIASRRRRESARFAALPQESRLPPEDPVELANLERDESLKVLSGALRGSDQKLFRLLYVTGASSTEVQDRLRISPEILRKRKHRLNLRLRHAIALEVEGAAKS